MQIMHGRYAYGKAAQKKKLNNRNRHLLSKAGVFFYAQMPMSELCQKGVAVPIQVGRTVFAASPYVGDTVNFKTYSKSNKLKKLETLFVMFGAYEKDAEETIPA